LDVRTDVYGLGAVLYYLFAGRPPFQGADDRTVSARLQAESPVALRQLDPRLHPDAERVCGIAMARSPEGRYRSADDLADDLDALLSIRALAGTEGSSPMPRGRHGTILVGFTAATIALVAGVGGWKWRGSSAALADHAERLRRVDACLAYGDLGRAEAEVQRAIAEAPGSGRAAYRLGRIELRRRLEREPLPALSVLGGKVGLEPAEAGAGEAGAARERMRSAFQRALEAGDLQTDERSVAVAGLEWLAGRSREAGEEFVRAANAFLPEPDLWLAAAAARYEAMDFAGALDAARAGLERRPGDEVLTIAAVRSLLGLGWVARSEGRDGRRNFEAARFLCEKQLVLNPGSARWLALEAECGRALDPK
jgi:tetratricopeptide (TPR) repeat protein